MSGVPVIELVVSRKSYGSLIVLYSNVLCHKTVIVK